jgi:hypothetical protein
MHWYNIFTVIGAAVLAAGLSYIGTQRATRRQLRPALMRSGPSGTPTRTPMLI